MFTGRSGRPPALDDRGRRGLLSGVIARAGLPPAAASTSGGPNGIGNFNRDAADFKVCVAVGQLARFAPAVRKVVVISIIVTVISYPKNEMITNCNC